MARSEWLAKNIKYYRKQKGLTQESLAFAVGVSEQAIGHYEKGRHAPDPNLIQSMAGVLGVSFDDLFDLPFGEHDVAVEYVSVWDGGYEVRTRARLNTQTKEVHCIETSDANVDCLEEEYIELADGTRVEVEERRGSYYAV